MNVEPIGEEYLRDVVAVENASFANPWSEQSFQNAFRSDLTTIYGAFGDDGILSGFACLFVIGEEAEILDIAAKPDQRRQGVGRALMLRMIEDCEKLGVKSVYLEVRVSNSAARSLYEKNGFIPQGIRRRYYTEPTEDAVVMKKTIKEDL
ncbi:MAG: ribosomal protein S18-alanine N-acetyltransferase [Clostridia bacterium]|nr:ribosomal protein S18-alanine N-acetyltransferase [Clostridia bacterium]